MVEKPEDYWKLLDTILYLWEAKHLVSSSGWMVHVLLTHQHVLYIYTVICMLTIFIPLLLTTWKSHYNHQLFHSTSIHILYHYFWSDVVLIWVCVDLESWLVVLYSNTIAWWWHHSIDQCHCFALDCLTFSNSNTNYFHDSSQLYKQNRIVEFMCLKSQSPKFSETCCHSSKSDGKCARSIIRPAVVLWSSAVVNQPTVHSETLNSARVF